MKFLVVGVSLESGRRIEERLIRIFQNAQFVTVTGDTLEGCREAGFTAILCDDFGPGRAGEKIRGRLRACYREIPQLVVAELGEAGAALPIEESPEELSALSSVDKNAAGRVFQDEFLDVFGDWVAESTVEGAVQKISQTVLDWLGVRWSIVGYGYQRGNFRWGAGSGLAGTLKSSFSINQEGVSGEFPQGAYTVQWNEANGTGPPITPAVFESDASPVSKAMGVCWLIGRGGQPLGVILVGDNVQGEWIAAKGAFLERIARWAVSGLQWVETRCSAERRADELDAVFASMADAVLVYDDQGRLLRANPAVVDLYGGDPIHMPAEAMGQQVKFYYLKGLPVASDDLPGARALAGEKIIDESFRFIDAHGRSRTLLASAMPLFSGEGISGAVVVWHDITEREQLLAQLKAERVRLNAIIENAPEGIVVADNRARIILTNPAADRLYQRPVPGESDRGDADENSAELLFCYPDDRPYTRRDFPLARSALEGVVCRDTEVVMVWPNRERRYLLVSSAPIRDGQGAIEGAVAIFQDITERRRLMAQVEEQRTRAERSAQETQLANNLLHALIDTMPIGMTVCDPGGAIVLSNPAAQEIVGGVVTGNAYGPRGGYTFHHWDGEPFLSADLPLVRAVEHGAVTRDVQILIRRADGTERAILAAGAPVRDSHHWIISALTVFQDITELKKAREEIRQYADRLKVLHEVDRTILAAPSAEELAGAVLHELYKLIPYQRASLAGFDYVHQETYLLVVQDFEGTQLAKGWRGPLAWVWFISELESGRPYSIEDLQAQVPVSPLMAMLQAEGIRMYASIPLRAQERLIGALNLGMKDADCLSPEQVHFAVEAADELAIGIQQADLQAQIRQHAAELENRVAERTAALQASEARFRAIFESSAIGIMLLDLEGRIIESNGALQTLLGYEAEELRGRHFLEWADPAFPVSEREWVHLLEDLGEVPYYQMELRYVCNQGQFIWVDLVITLVQESSGAFQFAIGMVKDITEQRQSQMALIQAEKLALAGKLAASLAHEINNPLQSVIGCLGLAEEILLEGGDVSRYLTVAGEELQRAARIVGQLRDLNRQSLLEDRELVDLNGLLERVLVLSQKQCKDRGIAVNWEPGLNLPPLRLVLDRIQQVFLNLALNAIDAMPGGGQLRVTIQPTLQPSGVMVTFADTGIGISEELLSSIFKPFYTTKSEGLGLGLFISRNIVEQHGGMIEVQSRVGEGTIFSVWLPGDRLV